jgi:hypothetical protein
MGTMGFNMANISIGKQVNINIVTNELLVMANIYPLVN